MTMIISDLRVKQTRCDHLETDTTAIVARVSLATLVRFDMC